MLPLLIGLWGAGPSTAQGVFPGQNWQEAAPDSQGVDAARLKAAVDYMDANFGEQGARELAIVRNGYLIWKGPNCDAYHNIWSSTKNYTSTLLGVLVSDGKCRLDDPAAITGSTAFLSGSARPSELTRER